MNFLPLAPNCFLSLGLASPSSLVQLDIGHLIYDPGENKVVIIFRLHLVSLHRACHNVCCLNNVFACTDLYVVTLIYIYHYKVSIFESETSSNLLQFNL